MKCDIIIPIGPGHQEHAHRAVGSVVIAKNYSQGPFHEIDVTAVDDPEGKLGRSKARNLAVADSKADWLFFLDADDLMHPEAFKYMDLSFDAVWGKIVEYKEGVLLERFQVPTITDIDTLLEVDPYLTIQMGHFVRAEIAKKEPFHEEMDAGEDWHYYLRIWNKYNCIKINAPFMCNVRGEHSTGPRSSNGVKWREAVERLIENAKVPLT
jgi:glycosyltransferase involved in cell wall biosynthesis